MISIMNLIFEYTYIYCIHDNIGTRCLRTHSKSSRCNRIAYYYERNIDTYYIYLIFVTIIIIKGF